MDPRFHCLTPHQQLRVRFAPYPCFHRDRLDTGVRGSQWFKLEAKVGLANYLVLEQLIAASLGDDFA
jgi:hypothetical protein